MEHTEFTDITHKKHLLVRRDLQSTPAVILKRMMIIILTVKKLGWVMHGLHLLKLQSMFMSMDILLALLKPVIPCIQK